MVSVVARPRVGQQEEMNATSYTNKTVVARYHCHQFETVHYCNLNPRDSLDFAALAMPLVRSQKTRRAPCASRLLLRSCLSLSRCPPAHCLAPWHLPPFVTSLTSPHLTFSLCSTASKSPAKTPLLKRLGELPPSLPVWLNACNRPSSPLSHLKLNLVCYPYLPPLSSALFSDRGFGGFC